MLAMGVLLMGKLMRRRKHVSYILRRLTKVKRLQMEMREYMGHSGTPERDCSIIAFCENGGM